MPPNYSGHSACPVLCLTKVCLFIVTTFFVLYLPLGDPQIICDAKNVPANKKGLICLCDFYDFMVRFADKTFVIIDKMICKTIDGLYDAKIKFYMALSTYDRDDYCRAGCCSDKDDTDCVREKKSMCKCRNKCCRRRV
ncbi:uncharacterized protein LOC114358278 [Ostrinia furnacalis]|uniref:uncharacterized protein LOC114358278 n=1 Tax=Ostrinia furnacalis TaxID=93504 RepID=UPI001039A111|nr:uncharacterized protein LOC114358278 [Ostrinia furnacalis]